MTALDWVLVGVAVLAAAAGSTQGFLATALGFVGFAAGALAGARVGPMLLSEGTDDANAPIVVIFAASLLGILLGLVLQRVGDRIRRRLGRPGGGVGRVVGLVDGALGAVFGAALVTVAAWLLSAAALQTPNLPASWRSEVRHSTVLRELRRTLPPADDAFALLARFDPLPGFDGPRATVEAPDPGIVHDRGARIGRRGVVRIEGSACGLGIVGSGWVVSQGYVVTNQHVIAGEGDTTVIPESGGGRHDAYPVYVNRVQDIAILAVPGLQVEGLRTVSNPQRETAVSILGYPLAGPFKVRAARIGTAQTVNGQDAYGVGPVERQVLPFRGLVEQGNSGGPLVNRQGRVVGTVFASSTRAGQPSGYAVPNSVVLDALPKITAGRAVDPGPCNH